MRTGENKYAGITLVEALIVIGVMGIAFGMVKLGTDWVAALSRQRVLLDAQWNAQVTLYDITRNVRNCKEIVSISSDTLVLAVFRPSEVQGWSNPTFVRTASTGTVIFQYVSVSTKTFLLRTYESPGGTRRSELLSDMLEPPVGDMYMFRPYPETMATGFEAVEVRMRLRPRSFRRGQSEDPIEYRTISMKRTASQK